jgi:MtaA/CmuA family methyltransferase
MTPYERVFSRLAGKPVDRIPNLNIVMTFAAKYIGASYGKYAKDYHCLVEGNLAVCDRFGIDMLSAISDPCRETADLGANIVFPEDGVPQCKDFLLKEYSDIRKLSVRNPLESERMLDRIRAIKLFKSEASQRYPILGWVEGAFAQANDLRGMTALMADIYLEPEFVEELLGICIEQEIAFAEEQANAGADFIGIGDAAASLVGPSVYESLILPCEKKLVDAIHAAGAKAKLHICGNTGKLLDLMPRTGADIIDVDWMVDFGKAAEAFGTHSLCGNFDPVGVLLRGSADMVRSAVHGCISVARSNTFIAAGCEVPRDTPEENLLAVMEALEEDAIGFQVNIQ